MTRPAKPKRPAKMQLKDDRGRRLYFTQEERDAFIEAAAKAPRQVRSLCNVLHYTGCPLSEALALTPERIDLSAKVISIRSLKKRQVVHYRRERECFGH